MKPIAVLLIALGLLLGPVYYAAVRLFSGTELGSFPLQPADPQDPGADYAPVVLDLTPDMGPVGLVLHVEAEWGPAHFESLSNRYRASLTHAEQELLERTVELTAYNLESGRQTFHEGLGAVDIPRPGRYLFSLTPLGEAELGDTRIGLSVRRNVREPDPRLVWSGVGALAVGIALLLL
jgi:hypothetical protein